MISSCCGSVQTCRIALALFALSLLLLSKTSNAQDATSKGIRELISTAIAKDPTMAATFLRLVFHDALTIDVESGEGGANGSIRFELSRGENGGLQRAVDTLTPIQNTTGISWGDVVAVAGAVAVEETGGPHIPVRFGRENVTREDPTGLIPSPGSSIAQLRQQFKPRGFTDRDIVALSGGHTLGRVRAVGPFTARPNKFHNDFFKNLMWFQERREKRLPEAIGPPQKPNFQLPSDLALLDDRKTREIVEEFAEDEGNFFKAFASSYSKLVSVGVSF